jgi:GntR family transcriptional regulator of vanillate catabolism
MPQFLRKLKSDSLADKAADMIRSAIFEGHIKPEERLTIEHIAAQLGISRTPVREALKALETDGMIKILPNRGAVVQRFGRPELADRFTVRATLEGLAGELACRNDGKRVAGLLAANTEKLAERMAEIEPEDLHAVSELVELNGEFHDTILAASQSETVLRMHSSLRMPMAYRLYTWRSVDRQRASYDFHRRIVDAFRQDDAGEVRRLLESHILEARDFVVAEH